MSKIRVIELFAGIGACSSALDRLNIEHEIVDAVEIDKFAIKSFNAVHGTNFQPQDITEYHKHFDDIDLIMHGSPCQDFSLAGLQKGGDEGSGTRSSLLYESVRIIADIRPKYVVWENVKNMLSVTHKHNFDNYVAKLDELGYNSYYQVLCAADYGMPQKRERVFTISIRKDLNQTFSFPAKQPLTTTLKDYVDTEIDYKYVLTIDELKRVNSWNTTQKPLKRIYGRNSIVNTLTARDCRGRSRGMYVFSLDFEDTTDITERLDEPTLPAIRMLSPKECWRLMGFTDEEFAVAEKVNSRTRLCDQAGNSIVVNCLVAIFQNLL